MVADEEAEQRAKELLADHDVDRAVEVILTTYGPRIFRMMMGVLHDETLAQEVYQEFSIQLWKSLSNFRGDSKVYTWTYTIARRAIGQRLRKGRGIEQRLHTHQEQEQVAKWTRTATAEWRKTEAKDKFRELVEDLDANDRTLVMLRIGESMGWKEIAEVLHDGDEPLDGSELTKASARLRKRFERVKESLKDALG